ncbi:hypothetical protein ECEPECA14_0581 [Escherichia coli EPECa14]|nr:hypothetical protein ECEPECA14_0581 [Escherichia coli EPECa14]
MYLKNDKTTPTKTVMNRVSRLVSITKAIPFEHFLFFHYHLRMAIAPRSKIMPLG